MVIEPGDIVIGDSDDVLAAPLADGRDVLARTQAKQEAEIKQLAEIANSTNDRSWVDAELTRPGCEMG